MKSMQNALQQALQLHQAGDFEAAQAAYVDMLQQNPSNSEVLYLLGSVCYQMGDLGLGKQYLEQSLTLKPDNPFALNNLGLVLAGTRNFGEAMAHYQQALRIKPDYLEAYNNLGNCYQSLHDYEKALVFYQQAIAIKPDYLKAIRNQGLAYQKLGQFEAAIKAFEKLIMLNSNSSEDFYNLANIYLTLDQSQQALAYYDRALALNPQYAHAYYNRGIVLQKHKDYQAALASFTSALTLEPGLNDGLSSVRYLKNSLCDWSDYSKDVHQILQTVTAGEVAVSPFALLLLTDNPQIQFEAARKFSQTLIPSTQVFQHNKPIRSRICLGFYSADFYDHATLHLLLETLESLSTSAFELIAFNLGPVTGDDWQRRAQHRFDQFIDCRALTDQAIGELSRRLAVDIAIDLKGYTQDARPGIFSTRPAPIIVNYLGFPGTMASPYHDYLIADKRVIPKHQQHWYSEKIIYLPGCYQPNSRITNLSAYELSRTVAGLPESGFVFCSFNQLAKLTPSVFALWMKILLVVERSVLWLLAPNLAAQNNLLREAAGFGVSPDRLVFAKSLPVTEHLQRLQLADLMLDSYPCGAHTTCSDALRMGVPVVTRRGQSFASRVAASLLDELQLNAWVADTEQEYLRIAIELAQNPQQLADVKKCLQENLLSGSLFSPEQYAKSLEKAFHHVYQRWVSGLSPEHIEL